MFASMQGQGGPVSVVQVVAPPRNTLAYVSLGAGLLSFCSILCCCIPVLNWGAFLAMFLFGLIAIVTGAIGLAASGRLGVGRTESIAGIVLGSFWVLAAIGSAVTFFMGCASLGALGAAGAAVDEGTSSPPLLAPGEPREPTPSAPGPSAPDPSGAPPVGAPASTATLDLGAPTEEWLDAPCAPVSVAASHALSTGHHGEDYPATNAFDDDTDTAWAVRDAVEGEEWIEATLPPGTRVSRVWLTTGYEKMGRVGDLFTLNAHLSRFTLETDAGRRTVDVGPSQREADVRLNVETTRVRLIAEGIYPGERWQDLSISEIRVYCAR